MGFFSKLKEGLTKTRDNIVSGIDSVFSGFSSIDDDFYDDDFLDDEEDEEPELKTDIQDCRRCWCDTCGRLEECEKHRDGTQPDGLRPLPCIGCVNGLRFKPKEEEPCEEYTEAAGFNNG